MGKSVVLEAVRHFIESNGICGSSIIVGLSGGADSVALVNALVSLSGGLNIAVSAAHFNHHIRGAAADRDEEFVKALCVKLGIKIFAYGDDVPRYALESGKTLEQAARDMRYAFLERARRESGADFIAVAHHMDDQAESVLMHLMRGSGLKGLTGMSGVRGRIIRPLLDVRRMDIEAFIRETGCEFMTDDTNFDAFGTRNKIRLELLPYIEKNIAPAIIPSLCGMARLLSEDEAHLRAEAEELLNSSYDGGGYCVERMACAAHPILTRAIRIAFERAGMLTDIEKKHVDMTEELMHMRTGASIDVPHGSVAVSYGRLIFGKRRSMEALSVDINVGENALLEFGGYTIRIEAQNARFERSAFAACFDADKLPSKKLTLRNRRDGDRFKPLNASGSKKFKDYLIDKKVPRDERDMPLICFGENVLYAYGLCVADSVKVTDETRNIAKVVFDKNQRMV